MRVKINEADTAVALGVSGGALKSHLARARRTYTVTGRSRLYLSGSVDCGPAGPFEVSSGVTQHVSVTCAEK